MLLGVAGDITGQIHSRCRLLAQVCTRHPVMRPRRIQRWRGNLGVASPETARAVHARLGRVVKMRVRFISILVALVVVVAVPGVA
jgi:hypothetical protein